MWIFRNVFFYTLGAWCWWWVQVVGGYFTLAVRDMMRVTSIWADKSGSLRIRLEFRKDWLSGSDVGSWLWSRAVGGRHEVVKFAAVDRNNFNLSITMILILFLTDDGDEQCGVQMEVCLESSTESKSISQKHRDWKLFTERLPNTKAKWID